MSGLNLGLKKSFMKDNFQLSLLVNDVFNTAYLKNYTSIVNGIKEVYSENNSSFRLSLTYNFGNDNISVKERDFGNDEERKRSN